MSEASATVTSQCTSADRNITSQQSTRSFNSNVNNTTIVIIYNNETGSRSKRRLLLGVVLISCKSSCRVIEGQITLITHYGVIVRAVKGLILTFPTAVIMGY